MQLNDRHCKVRRLLFGGLVILAFLSSSQMTLAEMETAKPIGSVGNFFALPMELDLDSGAANGDATILRIMPLYGFPTFERWKLIHLDVITLADAPGGTPAFPGEPGVPHSAGVSDLLHSSFFTPIGTGDFIWGIGAMASLPTATDESLGSGKWAAGPAFRLVYRTELWNFGVLGGQRWSFAGSGNRSDVNQLLMRGAIRRQLPNDWHFVSAPIIIANWDAAGEKWLVPVGGGLGRRFTIGKYPWAWSVQGYYNAIKPDAAPDWVVRFAVVAAVRFGGD